MTDSQINFEWKNQYDYGNMRFYWKEQGSHSLWWSIFLKKYGIVRDVDAVLLFEIDEFGRNSDVGFTMIENIKRIAPNL